MYIERISEIEGILEEQFNKDLDAVLSDSTKVQEAAIKLIEKALDGATVTMLPNEYGLKIKLFGKDIDLFGYKNYEQYVSEFVDLGALLKIKDHLNEWQKQVDTAINKKET